MYGEEKPKVEEPIAIYSTEEEIVPDVDDLPNIEEEDKARKVTMSSPTATGGIKIIKDLVKKTLK